MARPAERPLDRATATAPAAASPDVVTLGCRLNSQESAVIQTHLTQAGLGDTVVINSCAVTAEAERRVRSAIRRARRERPNAEIVVTGCAVQITPERYRAMPEVDRLVGNHEKLLPETWRASDRGTNDILDIQDVRETAGHMVSGFDGRTRVFLQVQNGCDHRCTFCIIPFGRGPSRSVPIGSIVDQARLAVATGYHEIVLTGVDVTSYGGDLPGRPTLGQMIRRLLACVPELPRLRLSSIDPVEIDDTLWRLIEHEPRLMPHLHLSLQAGADLVLKRMKRRHLRADILDLCGRARDLRPDIVFGADLIAGFPTETDAHFEATLDVVETCDLSYLHVFPYSAREGTPAARMPQVPPAVRRERAARLREAGANRFSRLLDREVGRTRRVLIEQDASGRTEHFVPTRMAEDPTSRPHPGAIVNTEIVARDTEGLIGRPLQVVVHSNWNAA